MNYRLTLAAAPVLMLLGCATQPQVYEADTEHSRAYHLAHAAGLWKAKDFDVPKDQREELSHAVYEITSGTALFNTHHGLGLSLGNAMGLSVLSYLFSPPPQLGRDTILAWVPSTQAQNQEEAVNVLSDALYEASLAVFEEQDMEYRVEYKDRERKAVWHPYYETRISFTLDEMNCGVGYQLFSGEVSNEAPIPEFILPDQKGYRFWAAHEIRYPSLNIGCRDADPAEGLKLAALISEKLPQGVYFYMAPRSSADREFKSPSMVLDQGESLLFITPEG